ncbi:MAG TPA: peptidoglycan-binding domain-containing protein [Thermoanaerobaculia bacterium]|nr:peptidoglycan-binding domain-containing protein [Thermoanaerobaculia bacterium]
MIQAAQHLLAALGYEVGKADGILRTATVQSIQRFQAEHRLEPTGVVDGALLVALSEEVMVRKGR